VNEIDVKLDLAGAAAATEVQQDMQAGTADLSWNTDVPPADVQGLETPSWNAQLGTFPAPGTTNPTWSQRPEPEQHRRARQRQGSPGAGVRG